MPAASKAPRDRGPRGAVPFAATIVLFSSWANTASAAPVHGCLEGGRVSQRLAQVLRAARPDQEPRVIVTLEETIGPDENALWLRVTSAEGEALLDRRYAILPQDCPNAAELLALVLEEMLHELPIQHWQAKTPEVRRGSGAVIRPHPRLEWLARLGVNGHLVPAGMDLETRIDATWGSLIDASLHRIAGSVLVRVSAPQDLGPGQFATLTALVGGGWRYQRPDGYLEAGAHGGTVLVSGLGYPQNASALQLWAELNGSAGWVWGDRFVGLQISVSPMRSSVVTSDRTHITYLPQIRVGLSLGFTFAAH